MKKNKKVMILVILIVLLLIFLLIVIPKIKGSSNKSSNNVSETEKENSTNENTNNNLIFDKDAIIEGTLSMGAILDDKNAAVLVSVKKKGESQNAIFRIKNNSNEKVVVSKDNISIRYRYPYDPDDEETYHIVEENLLEQYYDIELIQPKVPIILKPKKKMQIEVKATLKKEYGNKAVAGSFFVILDEPK